MMNKNGNHKDTKKMIASFIALMIFTVPAIVWMKQGADDELTSAIANGLSSSTCIGAMVMIGLIVQVFLMETIGKQKEQEEKEQEEKEQTHDSESESLS